VTVGPAIIRPMTEATSDELRISRGDPQLVEAIDVTDVVDPKRASVVRERPRLVA
jgi:hypothetical protein